MKSILILAVLIATAYCELTKELVNDNAYDTIKNDVTKMGEPLWDFFNLYFVFFTYGWCFWIGGITGLARKDGWSNGYKLCRSNLLMLIYRK